MIPLDQSTHDGAAMGPDKMSLDRGNEGKLVKILLKENPLITDASGVSVLIDWFGALRESMVPPVSREAPEQFRFTMNPQFHVRPDPEGGAIISIRYPGAGWGHARLHRGVVERLITELRKSLGAEPPKTSMQ
jgi:hypothetical protein